MGVGVVARHPRRFALLECLLRYRFPSSLSLRAGPGFLDPHRYCGAEAPFAIRFARGQIETETTEEEMPSPPRGRIMPRPTCCPTIKSLGAPWRFFAADVAWSGHLHGMQRSPSGVLVSLESLDRPLRSEMRMASRGPEPGPGENRILSARRMRLELIS